MKKPARYRSKAGNRKPGSRGRTNTSLRIARLMGLPDELEVLNRGGLLHDIGKIRIPADILDKPPAPNEGEMRWDGSGYPDGIAGEEIEFHARMLAAADVYHALTSHRAYRSGMTHADAVGMDSQTVGNAVRPANSQGVSCRHVRATGGASTPATPAYRPVASLTERP